MKLPRSKLSVDELYQKKTADGETLAMERVRFSALGWAMCSGAAGVGTYAPESGATDKWLSAKTRCG